MHHADLLLQTEATHRNDLSFASDCALQQLLCCIQCKSRLEQTCGECEEVQAPLRRE